MLKLLRNEAQVPAAWITAALFLIFGAGWFAAAANNTGVTLLLFGWLFAAILWSAFGVVRHAEHLAEKLGEPYGTLILTMAVTIIEVAFIITAVATSSGSSPVARDAVFAVVMIMLNGTIGLCLLLGGLRHHEQSYNLPGARAFLSVVIPLAVFALILPNFTVGASGPILSVPQALTIAALTLVLYGVFLTMQTVRHRSFFQDPFEADSSALPEAPLEPEHGSAHPVAYHTAFLLLTLAPAVVLELRYLHGHHQYRALDAVPICVVDPTNDFTILLNADFPTGAARFRNRKPLGMPCLSQFLSEHL